MKPLISTENHAVTTKTTAFNPYFRDRRVRVCDVHPFLFHEFPTLLFILTNLSYIICYNYFLFFNSSCRCLVLFYNALVLLEFRMYVWYVDVNNFLSYFLVQQSTCNKTRSVTTAYSSILLGIV